MLSRNITLIDRWGNERTIQQIGKMDRTKHAKVLSILEKRALRYRNTPVNDDRETMRSDSIDETGTVETEGLTDDDSAASALSDFGLTPMQKEFLEAAGVTDELLRVHGIAPGSKQEGVVRLIYENLNGLNSRMTDNEKLEKAREIIDDLEADIVCYNEHRLNLRHKQNIGMGSLSCSGGVRQRLGQWLPIMCTRAKRLEESRREEQQ
jgi:hypothetical protein